jgi:hypothetical protein
MTEEILLFKYYDVPISKPEYLSDSDYAELKICANYEINKLNKNCWRLLESENYNWSYKGNDSGACQFIGLNKNLKGIENPQLYEELVKLFDMKDFNDDFEPNTEIIENGPTKFSKFIKYILYKNDKIEKSDVAPQDVAPQDVAPQDVAHHDPPLAENESDFEKRLYAFPETTGGKPKSRRSNKKRSNKKKSNKKKRTNKKKTNKKKRKTNRRR